MCFDYLRDLGAVLPLAAEEDVPVSTSEFVPGILRDGLGPDVLVYELE